MTATTTHVSTSAAVLTPQAFSQSTADPYRDRWTGGTMRHVLAALGGSRVIVTIGGLAQVGVELLGLYQGSHEPQLRIRFTWGEGPNDYNDTRYSLRDIGQIIALDSTTAGHDAIRLHRAELSAAIATARDAHGESEGRAYGRWSAVSRTRDVFVRYEAMDNHGSDAPAGTDWSGSIPL